MPQNQHPDIIQPVDRFIMSPPNGGLDEQYFGKYQAHFEVYSDGSMRFRVIDSVLNFNIPDRDLRLFVPVELGDRVVSMNGCLDREACKKVWHSLVESGWSRDLKAELGLGDHLPQNAESGTP